MRIRTQLLLTILVPVTIFMIAVTAFYVPKLKEILDDTVQDLKVDLIEKEKQSVSIRTDDKTNLSRLMLGKSLFNIDYLIHASLHTSPATLAFNYPLYFNEPPLGTAPDTLVTTDKDARQHAAIHSGWFNTGINTVLQKNNYETNHANLSNLDNSFYPLYLSNADYLNVYFGAESDGHYQTEPWTPTQFSTLNYLAYPGMTPAVGYDPRNRLWYYEAFINKNKTILTNPYNDALTGKVLITMAKYLESGGFPQEGVYGLDIYLDDLTDAITGSKILENGKFYLTSVDGTAILYPDVDLDNVKTFTELIFTSFSEETKFQNEIWPQIVSNDKLQTTFQKDGNQWIITSVKVVPSNLAQNGGFFTDIDPTGVKIPYIVVAIVSVEDIEELPHEVEKVAKKNTNAMLAISIVVIIIFIVLSGVGIWYFARVISKPVSQLERMIHRLDGGDLEQDLTIFETVEFQSSSNMTAIGQQMQNVYKLLRFGNSSYFQGRYVAALKNYDEIAVMLSGNERAMGSVENNRGAVYQKMKNFQEADRHYQMAVDNAQKLMDNAEGDKKNKYERIKGNRIFNQASLGVAIYETNPNPAVIENIQKYLAETQIIADKYEDTMSQAKIKGLRGKLEQLRGNHDQARQFYEDAVQTMQNMKMSNPDKFRDNQLSLYYALLNLAEYWFQRGESVGNQQYRQWSLYYLDIFNKETVDQTVPTFILLRAVSLQMAVCKSLKLDGSLQELQGMIKQFPQLTQATHSLATPKRVDIAIDISGSMSGSRIRSVVACLKKLYNDYIHPNDKINLMVFNNQTRSLTGGQYLPKKNIEPILLNDANWFCNRATRFYQTINETLRRIYNYQSQQSNGVVDKFFILTDGSDTVLQSYEKRRIIEDIHHSLQKCRIDFMVMTIGDDHDKNEINAFIETAKKTNGVNSMHLTVSDNLSDLDEKFETVGQVMGGNEINTESII